MLFYDEAFFKLKTTIKRGWYLKGSAPTVTSRNVFAKIGVHSSVNSSSGELFSLMFDDFDTQTFVIYLQELLIHKKKNGNTKKTVIVLDNASPHKSKATKNFVQQHSDKLELLYLPPYSPDLNPQERVWKDIRYTRTHNRYFEDKSELLGIIEKYLKDYSIPNQKLLNLCRVISVV